MVNLHCPGADTDRNTLRCRAWSLELAWLDDL
jgi:hypothetical protein